MNFESFLQSLVSDDSQTPADNSLLGLYDQDSLLIRAQDNPEDEHVRKYFVNRRLNFNEIFIDSTATHQQFLAQDTPAGDWLPVSGYNESLHAYACDLHRRAQKLATALRTTSGVLKIILDNNILHIQKAKAFAWSEIDTPVVSYLAELYPQESVPGLPAVRTQSSSLHVEYPAPCAVEYNFRQSLGELSGHIINVQSIVHPELLEHANPVVRELVAHLFAVPGVYTVIVQQYAVTITFSDEAFERGPIESAAATIIEDYLDQL